MRTFRLLVIAAALALSGATVLTAGPVIYNTGSSGMQGLPDTHYQLIALPGVYPNQLPQDLTSYSTSPAYIVTMSTLPPGTWMDYPTGTEWIGPTASYQNNWRSPAGTYVYRTTFDLTGYDPRTVALAGVWSSDNCGVDIRINGVSTGSWGMAQPTCRSTTHGFALTGSSTLQSLFGNATLSQIVPFVQGVNTIEYIVVNDPPNGLWNPTGVAVQYTMFRADLIAPEPGSFALLGAGLGALLLIVRRKRSL